MKNFKIYTQYLFLLTFLFLNSCKKPVDKIYRESDINIIPKVASLEINAGVFQFDKNTQFVVSNDTQKNVAKILIDRFKIVADWDLKITETAPKENYIIFKKDGSLANEAYELLVTKNEITITASNLSGYLYSIQSLRQLLPVEIERQEKVSNVDWEIPNLTIKDSPRFQWRGLMLDISRHFFGKEYIKETIDALAMHKMNILHLHLVDDQGWRIEIKKYPKLTEIGAFRVDQEALHWNKRKAVTSEQKGTYGGFLTQEELKEIVAYAISKGVEVVPEIEMPAHVSSAIAAYPELSCFDKEIGVPSGGVWPITDIYCAGKENTFHFLEAVLTEVMAIFPSKYIHIGGDEATKTNWKICPHCQKRMKKEGLHDVEELQSYFIQRIEKFINANGKKLIGWDEILEGGLAPDATVMSWRGVKGGLQAAAEGHDVVMSPTSHSYFDYYQGPAEKEPLAIGGYTPLSKVYQFDPIVPSMSAKEAAHVLGGQANLWSEYIPTESHSQYMIFPRLTALSETLWSTKKSRNWPDFSNRLQPMLQRYEYLGINYAKSSFLLKSEIAINADKKSASLILTNEHPTANIKYALDNDALNRSSKTYTKPISLTATTVVKASIFSDDKLTGALFLDTIKFHKAIASNLIFKTKYSNKYKGSGEFTLVNTLRGTKNFRDGRWQAWLNKEAHIILDLGDQKLVSQVVVGAMENQRNGIYYPSEIKIFTSNDGESFKEITALKRPFKVNKAQELKDFKIDFKSQNTRFIKIEANFSKKRKDIKEFWLFFDEILIY
ncbi:family 20 glycosylhydrolase [uncultured Polaribacter sp.]|uniref:beta-N-acetylhexosaminidase n=1 Tax=uncultured Polaribacter sp. TaxID=174711 RepID=UPI0026275C0D|nr:family 20 glycosylhydrolase [uncultured Polaribacter sp.]